MSHLKEQFQKQVKPVISKIEKDFKKLTVELKKVPLSVEEADALIFQKRELSL